MKGLLLGAAALDAAGNLMYALAEVAASPYLLLAGRLTSGVAAGSGVLASVYVGTFKLGCGQSAGKPLFDWA